MAKLLYSTSFEDATVRDANRLYMGIENWVTLQGGGYYAIDHTHAHTGTTSLKAVCPAGTGTRRAELTIAGFDQLTNPSLTFPTNECYVSVWQYLPENWHLNGLGFNWSSICNPFELWNPSGSYYPKCELHINKPVGTQERYTLELGYGENYPYIDPGRILGKIDPFTLPLGKWYHLEWWLYLHETNGRIKFWIDNYLLADASGLKTRRPFDPIQGHRWINAPLKTYTDDEGAMRGATNELITWADDLEIWDGMPTEEPPAPVMHTLTIMQSTGGITTPAPGSYEYLEGTEITLTAIPNEGYQFTRWISSDETAGGITPVINWIVRRDITLIAEFAPITVQPCFIATAAYGSPLAVQLDTFRAFRDKSLPDRLVDVYYRASPPLANWIAKHRHAKAYVRSTLDILERVLRGDHKK